MSEKLGILDIEAEMIPDVRVPCSAHGQKKDCAGVVFLPGMSETHGFFGPTLNLFRVYST
eukprot:scaffold269447_cov20-Prasinocladus_malaysianus.AAC.1